MHRGNGSLKSAFCLPAAVLRGAGAMVEWLRAGAGLLLVLGALMMLRRSCY